MSLYYKEKEGSAIFSVLILLSVVSSLVLIIINNNQNLYKLTERYESNSKILYQIKSVEDFAVDMLKSNLSKNSYSSNYHQEWGQPTIKFPIGPYLIDSKLLDLDNKLNINNLIKKNQYSVYASDTDYTHLQSFIRLFNLLNIDRNKIDSLIDWIDVDSEMFSSYGAEDGFYIQKSPSYRTANNYLSNIDELFLIRGFDNEIINKIKPYVTTLPTGNLVNINTTNEIVLRSLHNVIGPTFAAEISKRAKEEPFKNMSEFKNFLKNQLRLSDRDINQIASLTTTKSKNYALEAKISYMKHFIEFETLIYEKKENDSFRKYNRIIKKFGSL